MSGSQSIRIDGHNQTRNSRKEGTKLRRRDLVTVISVFTFLWAFSSVSHAGWFDAQRSDSYSRQSPYPLAAISPAAYLWPDLRITDACKEIVNEDIDGIETEFQVTVKNFGGNQGLNVLSRMQVSMDAVTVWDPETTQLPGFAYSVSAPVPRSGQSVTVRTFGGFFLNTLDERALSINHFIEFYADEYDWVAESNENNNDLQTRWPTLVECQ